MSGDQSEVYSTLEVDGTSTLPVTIPDTGAPEVTNVSGKEVTNEVENEVAIDETQKRTICGIRRRTFWILVILATLVLVGVAVGVGVGVNRHTESDQQSSQQDSYKRGVAPNSDLAAANYTDPNGAEHSQVYYQDNSLGIWMTDWNSSSDSWTPSPVSDKGSANVIYPKNGTPIAANNWILDGDAIKKGADFRCFFVDNSSVIRALWARNQTTTEWRSLNTFDNGTSPSDITHLELWNPQCDNRTCDPSDLLFFQARTGELHTITLINGDSTDLAVKDSTFLPKGVKNDAGTAMATAPVPLIWESDTPRLAFYFFSQNTLVEMYKGRDVKWSNSLNLGSSITADHGARLAAMSQVVDGVVRIQVLITRSTGGVHIAYWASDTSRWLSGGLVAGMDGVLPVSPIASTQSGRVYAFEDGPKIVEWKMMEQTQPSTQPPTFKRLGPIGGTT